MVGVWGWSFFTRGERWWAAAAAEGVEREIARDRAFLSRSSAKPLDASPLKIGSSAAYPAHNKQKEGQGVLGLGAG